VALQARLITAEELERMPVNDKQVELVIWITSMPARDWTGLFGLD
jgi:hypothetical protein